MSWINKVETTLIQLEFPTKKMKLSKHLGTTNMSINLLENICHLMDFALLVDQTVKKNLKI